MGLKYHNIKTEISGIKFDSKKESKYFNDLTLLKKSKHIIDFKLQPEFEYYITYSHPLKSNTFTVKRKYIADFKIYNLDGSIEIWDVKGFKTAIYKQKKKIIEKIYGIKIIEK